MKRRAHSPKAKSTSKSILAMLAGGDRRSLGRADDAVALVLANQRLFPQLIREIWNEDEVVRMRAADAAEKVSREAPQLLAPFKKELLGLLAEETQIEVRWHLAQMIPRLPLTAGERARAADCFRGYLDDNSSIVRTCAMQALCELTADDQELRTEVLELVRALTATGTPAMRARGRKLLAQLEKS